MTRLLHEVSDGMAHFQKPPMKLSLLVLLFASLSCAPKPEPDAGAISDFDWLAKCDLPLRRSLEAAVDSTVLSFTGQSEALLNSALRDEIEATGVVVGSVIGDIFTMRGSKAQVQKVARLPFVIRLEGEKRYQPRSEN